MVDAATRVARCCARTVAEGKRGVVVDVATDC
jgi:hypothetical protein